MGMSDRKAEKRVEADVEELIDRYAQTFKSNDDDFIGALEIMVDHAQTAIDARKEEIGDDGDEDDD